MSGRVGGGRSGLVLVGEKRQVEAVEFLKEHGAVE